MAESPANFENPCPNLVLGQSEDSPRTARNLGQSLDGVRGLNSDCPRTVLRLSERTLIIINISNIIYLNKKHCTRIEPTTSSNTYVVHIYH